MLITAPNERRLRRRQIIKELTAAGIIPDVIFACTTLSLGEAHCGVKLFDAGIYTT